MYQDFNRAVEIRQKNHLLLSGCIYFKSLKSVTNIHYHPPSVSSYLQLLIDSLLTLCAVFHIKPKGASMQLSYNCDLAAHDKCRRKKLTV